MRFEDLPMEMQAYLLDFLLPEEWVSVAQINHAFSRLLKSQSLWKKKWNTHFPHLLSSVADLPETDWRVEFWEAYKEDYSSIFSSPFIYRSHEKKITKLFSLVKEGKSSASDFDSLLQLPSFKSMFDTRADLFQLEGMLDEQGMTPIDWARKVNNQGALDYFYQRIQGYCRSLNFLVDWTNNRLYLYGQYPVKVRLAFWQTLLYWAIVLNQPLSHIAILLAQGASLNEEYRMKRDYIFELPAIALLNRFFNELDMKSFFPIHLAALYNRSDLIVEWLQKDPECLNQLDGMQRTPLHWALIGKSDSAAQLLLEKGANFSLVSMGRYGRAILLASVQGMLEPLCFIFKKDPSAIDQADYCGYTPLHLAIKYERIDMAIHLVKRGASLHVRAQDESRKLPANIKPIHAAAMKGLIDVVSCIVERDSQMLNELDSSAQTPLMLAIRCQQTKMIDWLIRAGADTNQEVRYRRHLLHLAAKFGLSSLVEGLLEKDNSIVNVEDTLNITPLFQAAKHNQVDVAKILIRFGASIERASVVGDVTPLMIAITRHHDDMVLLLLKHGAKRVSLSPFYYSKKASLLWGLFDYIELREKSAKKYVSCFTFFGHTMIFGQEREKELAAARVLRDIIIYDADPNLLHVHHRNVVLGDRDLREIYNCFKSSISGLQANNDVAPSLALGV